MVQKSKFMGVRAALWGRSRGRRPLALLPSTSIKILIVAGEASGDGHAARLAAAIRALKPQVEFLGIGGENMAAQGVRILVPASELAVVGLLEVAGRLPTVWRALTAVGRALKRERPDLAILVDFPDFNFWVARLAKYFGVPVMYYISPQVWAWRTYRVRTLARLVDRLVVIFPFEAEFYRERQLPVAYVGHPLMETLPPTVDRRQFLAQWGLDPERLTIALLPGSRASEIERHLPIMLKAAHLIQQSIPQTQFILPLASTAPMELVREIMDKVLGERPGITSPCPPPNLPSQLGKGRGEGPSVPRPLSLIIPGQAYQALTAAHLAVVASGTATVEAALAATPTIIVYRLSPLTYHVGRRLIRVDHVGMANLLAGARLFPELLQEEFTPERVCQEVLGLIRDQDRLGSLRQGLAGVVSLLKGPGASGRAARVALEVIATKPAPGPCHTA